MTPAEIVAFLNTTTPELSARLRELRGLWKEPNPDIQARFFYLAPKDGKPTLLELIEVAHARIVNFVIPAGQIAAAQDEMLNNPGSADAYVRLTTEARNLFMKTHDETGRSGELGELLLYMLVEWVLQAPIVACKMYLKTSLQMPVHGVDGIHLGSNDAGLVFYWGESKLHEHLSSALDSVIESITEHAGSPEKHQNEVRIIRSQMNLTGMNASAQEALRKYFNPYEEESNKIKDCFSCLVGFDSTAYDRAGVDSFEEDFEKLYKERADTAFSLIKQKIANSGLSSFHFIYFLLPFPSVDDARQKFQNLLWGER